MLAHLPFGFDHLERLCGSIEQCSIESYLDNTLLICDANFAEKRMLCQLKKYSNFLEAYTFFDKIRLILYPQVRNSSPT